MVVCRALALITLAALAAPLGACATASPPSLVADGPSVVEYIPVRQAAKARPPGTPAAPPAMFVRADDDGDALGPFGSTVRYEPIALAAPRPTSPRVVPAVDDDDLTTPSEPDDLPQEDRPTAARSTPPARVKPNVPVDPSRYAPRVLASGIVVPYPLDHVFRGFGPCVGKRHHHEAIDIGGVGPDWGVGTPIHAMARSEVVFIGTGAQNPDDFGLPDRRAGEAQRGDRLLPRSARIEPYGDVYFFTRKKGRWRSGTILVTRALEGPLAGHTIRYLHMAAIHPDVKVGGVVEAGQEIALMGGTGVQESAPHLHLDIAAPDGKRLDVAALLGLPATTSCKGRTGEPEEAILASRTSAPPIMPPPSTTKKVANVASKTTAALPERGEPEGDVLARAVSVPECGVFTQKEDFSSGRYKAHALTFQADKGERFAVELQRKAGGWKPKLVVDAGKKAATVKWLGTGQAGKRAYAVIDVKKAGPVRLEVMAWDKAEPPTSALYQIHVAERCAKAKKSGPRARR